MNLHTIGRVMRDFSPHFLKSLSSPLIAGLVVAAIAEISSANAAFRSATFRVGLTIVSANQAVQKKNKTRQTNQNACGGSKNIFKFKELRFRDSLEKTKKFESKPINHEMRRKYVVCIY